MATGPNDGKYQYAFQSEDGKSVWLGQGLGGGTLHFGLQYIDTDDLITNSYNEWKNRNGENLVDVINNMTKAECYTYEIDSNGDKNLTNHIII